MYWFVYILLCSDGSYYTGITNNLEKRFLLHVSGKGAAYTRSHRPKQIVYTEKLVTRSQALSREYDIKKLSKDQKSQLIQNFPADLPNL